MLLVLPIAMSFILFLYGHEPVALKGIGTLLSLETLGFINTDFIFPFTDSTDNKKKEKEPKIS